MSLLRYMLYITNKTTLLLCSLSIRLWRMTWMRVRGSWLMWWLNANFRSERALKSILTCIKKLMIGQWQLVRQRKQYITIHISYSGAFPLLIYKRLKAKRPISFSITGKTEGKIKWLWSYLSSFKIRCQYPYNNSACPCHESMSSPGYCGFQYGTPASSLPFIPFPYSFQRHYMTLFKCSWFQ